MKTLSINDDSVLTLPLGRLNSFDPAQFILAKGDVSSSDRLVLTLAIAYNDLKDILFWQEVNRELSPTAPKSGTVDKKFGQSCGVGTHIFRLLCSWLVEVVTLLEKNNDAIKAESWQKLVDALPAASRDAWLDLMSLTSDMADQLGSRQKRVRDIYKYLVQVRSHGGFHYYQTKPFGGGFQSHFNGNTLEQSRAYVSDGQNLEESRFFFADAAITATCFNFASGILEKPEDEVSKFLRASHVGIRGVVYSYLMSKNVTFKNEE